MVKKYKHISLPSRYIGGQSSYIREFNGFPPQPDLSQVNFTEQKEKINSGFNHIKTLVNNKNTKIVLPADKEIAELKIKFLGTPTKKMLEKYRISVYEYRKDENALIGKISNKKDIGQKKSDFERLDEDMHKYVQTNKLKTHFQTIDNIEPLTFKEIVDEKLQELYAVSPDQKSFIDISFSSKNRNKIDQKIDILKDAFKENFLSRVNTDLVHFCRLFASMKEIKDITESFNEVDNISVAPRYLLQSTVSSPLGEDVTTTPPPRSHNPIIILDSSCNTNHITIKDAVLEENNIDTDDQGHATGVASLAVCGMELTPRGNIIQKNNIITIQYDTTRVEEQIVEIVDKYSKIYPLLLINLSANFYDDQFYTGSKRKSKLTLVIDDLSNKYNCLFFISAGNLFSRDTWTPHMNNACLAVGYPDYFKLPFTNILPPSDSISSVTVGSLTYQASSRSIAPANYPSPITRKNFENNVFIKPDFLHFDSNAFINNRNELETEDNGHYMAHSNDGKLTRAIGTSFATPLMIHEAGILHNLYPSYSNTSIKGLLVHFSDEVKAENITDDDIRSRLTGFGKPDTTKALYSLNHSSTIIVEDNIGMNQTKVIKIPVPLCLKGSARRRLRLRKTLVYNPIISVKDSENYNPIKISACIKNPDNREVEGFSTQDKAHMKSNVKKYPSIEKSTNNEHQGKFWEVEIRSECKIEDFDIDPTYIQNYSLIVSVEDINCDENINIHQDISQMIEVDIPVPVDV